MDARSVRIGDAKVTAVLDAAADVPCSLFFPQIAEAAWAPYAEHILPDGKSMTLSITSYVVEAPGATVLVDTGIGAKDRPRYPTGRLPEALREAGFALDAIDVVLATHLHIDHVGWHTTTQGEAYVPTFPRALHLIHRADWEHFTSPEQVDQPFNPQIRDCVLPLEGLAEIELVDGAYRVTDEVSLLPTPGHTPGHVSVLVESRGEAGVIIGDVCHNPAEMIETSWSPVFDVDPVKSAETREALMQRIERDGLLVIAGHFAYPGFGRLEREGGRRRWVAG